MTDADSGSGAPGTIPTGEIQGSPPPRITDPRAIPATLPARAKVYFQLTKPRIIELLLITTVPAMIAAESGWPSLWLVAATLAGGTLSAAGANTINSVVDRDIDRIMRRTRSRPLPSGRVEPRPALVFGVGLGLAGFLWLWGAANLLAATLSSSGLVFYVFVYTLWLKRTTPQNIVIGGAAGAVPALVGWAAVTGSLAAPAWIMFAIVFLWTPPHFWALSLRYEDDYRAAGVPMLPVVVGPRPTLDHIVWYTVALVGGSLLLYPTDAVGGVYLVSALALGAWIIVAALQLRRRPVQAMRFFGFSNVYLAVLFTAIAVDVLLG
jgi:protoheme IX farnesyltransferase